VCAQENSTDAKAKLLTPEASLGLRSISDLRFSPDGSRLAFVVAEPPKEKGRARHIWIYEKSSGAVRQFTFSQKSESYPRWSPDGTRLAFLSNREGDQQQIYILRTNGGEGAAVTKGKRSVSAFEWSPDGKQIAFLAPDAKTEAEEKKEKDKDDARVVDKDNKWARVWLLDLASAQVRSLTKPSWRVESLVWMPAGDRLILQATDHPESDQWTDKIYSLQISDGAVKALLTPRGPFRKISVSPDGKGMAFIGPREDGPEPHDLMVLPAGAPVAKNLTGASLDRLVEDFHWLKDSTLLLVAADGFKNLLVSYAADASRHDMSPSP